MVRAINRFFTLAVASFPLLALLGCTPTDLDDPETDLTAQDAVIAFRYSPGFWNGWTDQGSLVLIDADMHSEGIGLRAQVGGTVQWQHDSFFFGGDGEEFVLNADGLQSLSTGIDDEIQAERYALDDGTFWALYNLGVGQPFASTVVQGDGEGSPQVKKHEGYVTITGACGDEVYGVLNLQETSLKEGDSYFVEGLIRLHPWSEELAQNIVGSQSLSDQNPSFSGPNLQCIDGNATYLEAYYDEDTDSDLELPMVLVSWDMKTGDRTETPVVDRKGQALVGGSEILVFGSAAFAGMYYWLDGGSVYATAPDTGVTEEVAELGDILSYQFVDDKLFIISPSDAQAGLEVSYYDLVTGAQQRLAAITGKAAQGKQDWIVGERFAVDENWAATL